MTVRTLMIDMDGVVIRHPEGLRWDHSIKADLGVDPAKFQSAFFAAHWPGVMAGRAGLHERLALALPEFAGHLPHAEVRAQRASTHAGPGLP